VNSQFGFYLTTKSTIPIIMKWLYETDEYGKERLNLTKILAITVPLVTLLWGGMTWLLLIYSENSHEIGDTFGAVNALFSSLAFAFLIYTSLLQQQELGLQREELKLQRQEIKDNRIELAKTASAQETMAVLQREINDRDKLPGFEWIKAEELDEYVRLLLKSNNTSPILITKVESLAENDTIENHPKQFLDVNEIFSIEFKLNALPTQDYIFRIDYVDSLMQGYYCSMFYRNEKVYHISKSKTWNK